MCIRDSLYPVFATQYNNYRQESIASQFSAVAEDAGPDAVAENLRRADEYNANAAESPILDPWLDAQRPGTEAYQEYLSQLLSRIHIYERPCGADFL